MYGLFLTRHITTSSSIGSPYLRQRLHNSRELFGRGRYVPALKAIFDKQESEPAGEVEYGGSFPLDQMQRIIKGHEMYCDETLLNLIARADRSRYEDVAGGSEVTSAELALYEHIVKRHRALGKKYVGK